MRNAAAACRWTGNDKTTTRTERKIFITDYRNNNFIVLLWDEVTKFTREENDNVAIGGWIK